MKLSDCIFSEKDIEQLQNYRDRQKDTRLKLRFMAILSVIYNADGIEAGIRGCLKSKTDKIFLMYSRKYLC